MESTGIGIAAPTEAPKTEDLPDALRFEQEQAQGEAKMKLCRAIEILDESAVMLGTHWTKGRYKGCLVGTVISAARRRHEPL